MRIPARVARNLDFRLSVSCRTMSSDPARAAHPESQSDLFDLLSLLVRHSRFLLIVTIAASIAGALVSGLRPPAHSAYATVAVEGVEDIETEIALAKTDKAVEVAEDELPAETSLENDLTVESEAPSVLVFGYTSPDRELAKKAAQVMASTYLELRSERLRARQVTARESLQERLQRALDEKKAIEHRLPAGGDADLETQRDLLILRISRLQDSLQAIDPYLTDLEVGEIVSSSVSSVSRPYSILRGAVIGGLLGLIAAIAILFLQYTGTRVLREVNSSREQSTNNAKSRR